MEHGADAHIARFECHVEICAREPVVAQFGRGIAHCLDLGMRRRVRRRDRPVPALADDFSVERYDRANRYLALLLGAARQLQRPAHEILVGHKGVRAIFLLHLPRAVVTGKLL